METLLTHMWTSAQYVYYEWIGSKKIGIKWMATLIKKLRTISLTIWDHCDTILHEEENY